MVLLSELAFFTFAEDELSCVSAAYYHASTDRVYIDVKYLHASLGYASGYHFYDWFKATSHKLVNNGIPQAMVHKGSRARDYLSQHVFEVYAFVSTLALAPFLRQMRDVQIAISMRYLCKIASLCAVPAAITLAAIPLYALGRGLQFRSNGTIEGWSSIIHTHYAALHPEWNRLMAQHTFGRLLSSTFEHALLCDVLHFTILMTGQLAFGPVLDMMQAVLKALVEWLSEHFRALLIGRMPASTSGPRTLRHVGSSRNRPTDANTAWHILQVAREKQLTPGQILAANDGQIHLQGLSPRVGHGWTLVELNQFMMNSVAKFGGRLQVSMAFDPSTYTGEETAVAVLYSPSAGSSTYGPIKRIPAGKIVRPDEVSMYEEIEVMAAVRKCERWAAYKELRAISDILRDVTRYPIPCFKLGADFVVRAANKDEIRILGRDFRPVLVTVGPDGSLQARTKVLPDDFDIDDVPILVIYIDQGPVGLAALHFAMGHLGLMIVTRFDGFHRGVNDIKDGAKSSCRAVFRLTMLYLAHIMAINYGPFGKGHNFDEKRGHLEYFMSMLDYTSEEFRSFAPQWAKVVDHSS